MALASAVLIAGGVITGGWASDLAAPVEAADGDVAPIFDRFDGAGPSDDDLNAYLLGMLSHYVYESNVPAGAGAFIDRFRTSFEPLGLRDITFLNDSETGTQGVVVETATAVIVAFRGTQFGDCTDGDEEACTDIFIDSQSLAPTGIHTGFLLAEVSVEDQLLDRLVGNTKPVWFTGHSLGGALAQVAAYRLRDAVTTGGVVTFGAPQVFTAVPLFVPPASWPSTVYNARLAARSHRWVNHLDPVPFAVGLTAPQWGYIHVGTLHRIQVADTGACSVVATAPFLSTSIADHETRHYVTRLLSFMSNDDLFRVEEAGPHFDGSGPGTGLENPPEPESIRADCDVPPNPLCPPGSSSASGSAPCTPCASGYYTTATGSTTCTATQPGYYVSNPAGPLRSCAVGSYQDLPAQTTCKETPPGYYNPYVAATSPIPCEVGRYAPLAGTTITCLLSPPGYYVPTQGSASATPCAAGRYQPVAGNMSCLLASPGHYVSSPASTAQTECPPGRFEPGAGSSLCRPTPPGYYAPSTGTIEPTACEPGSYQSRSESTSCEVTPAGHVNPYSAASSPIPCAPGTYEPDTGQTAPCQAADPGHYVASAGSASQTPCAAGQYQPNPGYISCVSASPGHFVPEPASTAQIECPAGRFEPTTGSSLCSPTPPGYYAPTTGTVDALACAAGTYQPASESTSCLPAPPGTYVDGQGASAATPCGLGYFAESEGSVSCEAAPVATYVDVEGASAVTTCPAGTSTITVASTSSADCLTDTDGDLMPDLTDPDDDNDAVDDADDLCANTLVGVADRPSELKKNRYYVGDDGRFVDADGVSLGIDVTQTGGCAGAQIIDAAGLGQGHERYGLTRSAVLDWIDEAGL